MKNSRRSQIAVLIVLAISIIVSFLFASQRKRVTLFSLSSSTGVYIRLQYVLIVIAICAIIYFIAFFEKKKISIAISIAAIVTDLLPILITNYRIYRGFNYLFMQNVLYVCSHATAHVYYGGIFYSLLIIFSALLIIFMKENRKQERQKRTKEREKGKTERKIEKKNGKKEIVLVIIRLLGCLVAPWIIAYEIYKTNSNGLTLILVVAFLVVFYYYTMYYLEKGEKQQKKFYEECCKNDIKECTTEKEREKILLIAKRNNVNLDSDISTYFYEAKQKFESQKLENAAIKHKMELKSELDKQKSQEEECYKQISEYALCYGQEKRIKMLKDEREKVRKEIQKQQQDIASANRIFIEKEHDPYIHGGIAAGLAGNGAGVARALEIQQKNNEIKARNAQTVKNLTPLFVDMSEKLSKLRKYEEKLSEEIEAAELKLVSKEKRESCFEKLSFSNTQIEVTKTGSCIISTEIEMMEPIVIFDDIKGVIDGTITAVIYDGEHRIGTAHMVLPKCGISYGMKTELKGIALFCGETDKNYTIKFSALDNLWAAEPCDSSIEQYNYPPAMKLFEYVSNLKDIDGKIDICQKNIDNLMAEKERLEQERKPEITCQEEEPAAKRIKKLTIISGFMCVLVVAMYIWNSLVAPKIIDNKYNEAIKLMDAGETAKALQLFVALDSYEDSYEKAEECREEMHNESAYSNAISLMNSGKLKEALDVLVELGGYRDSYEKASECRKEIQYNEATELLESGNIRKASELFKELDDYKDSAEKVKECKIKALKSVEVGDSIFFGKYEQDNNVDNGKEEIEWCVIAVEDEKALLLSIYALDSKKYNNKQTEVTWETCSLRKWLNNDFIKNSFTEEEKEFISTATMPADKGSFVTDPGNATKDQVFLLEMKEVKEYRLNTVCVPTDYAVANGTDLTDGLCRWLLRTPGMNQKHVLYYGVDGYVDQLKVSDASGAIRPAMWINLK